MKPMKLAALAALIAAPAAAENWDMPMAYPDSNFHSQNGKLFAEKVAACTEGALTITIHAGGSLFGGADIKRAVQTGQAPIGERLLSAHANEDPLFGVDSVPFLATSYEQSDKLWAATKDAIGEALAEQNLVLLYSVPWPPQGFYFKKEVESIEDMAGTKFRAYNAATAKLAELTKMLPVQVEAAELTQALATGVAESFISSGSTGVDSKVWEQLTHFYDTQAWLPRNTVFANKDAFEALDEKSRGCLLSAAAEAQAAGTAKSAELAGGYLKTLAENGMQVLAPSDALKSGLAEVGAVMAADWEAAAGDKGAALLEAYKAQ